MELASSRILPVDRATAWTALQDPQALQAAIPGCESLERTGENEFAAVMVAAIGPVKARFRGKLTMEDVVAPESYTVRFEGQGGPAGFGKGSARVSLTPEGTQTRLDYRVDAQVGGRIAQVGQRLVDATAAKLADEFFDAFTARLGPPAAPAAPTPPAPRRLRAIGLALLAAIVVAVAAWLLLR